MGDVNQSDISKMTKEQLQKHAATLAEEIDREREERNYFQLERDKIETNYKILEHQLERCRVLNKNVETDLDYVQQQQQEELLNYKRNVKQIIYDYHEKLNEQQSRHFVTEAMQRQNHRAQLEELMKKISLAEKDKLECKASYMKKFVNVKLECLKDMKEFSDRVQLDMSDMERETDEQIRKMQEDFALMAKVETAKMAERQNDQIQLLIKQQQESLERMKTYYTGIIANSMGIIQKLTEKLEQQGKKVKNIDKSRLEEMKKIISDKAA